MQVQRQQPEYMMNHYVQQRREDARMNYDKRRFDLEWSCANGQLSVEERDRELEQLYNLAFGPIPKPRSRFAETLDRVSANAKEFSAPYRPRWVNRGTSSDLCHLPCARVATFVRQVVPKADFDRIFAQTLDDACVEVAHVKKAHGAKAAKRTERAYNRILLVALAAYWLDKLRTCGRQG